MKSSVEKVGNLGRKLNIEVPAAVVNAAFQKLYQSIQKEVTIKGFRQGKAPMDTVKSMYGSKVKEDVVNDLIQKSYFQAVQEHKLQPVNYPEFEFDVPTEGKDFSFSAQFEIRPEISVTKYEGLEVLKEKFEFDETQVDKVIENIQRSRAETVPVFESRPAQLGDIAVVDFEGFVDGAPLQNGAGQDHNLELGSNSFIAGFEEGIVGMSLGGIKTLNLKFPEEYHAADLSGKPVEFKVTLKELKKKSLPDLSPEFLQTMGITGDIETLKTNIREDITNSEQKRIDTDFKNRLLKRLAALNPVEVPPSVLKEQKESLIQDTAKRMKEQGLSDSEYKQYVQKWDGDFEKTASEMVQTGFLIDALAQKLNLSCTSEDVEKKYQEYAKQTGIEEERIREFYSKDAQHNRLTYMITEEKVLDTLIKSAKVKEVPKKELNEGEN